MGLSNVFNGWSILQIQVVHAVLRPIPLACLCMRSLVQAVAAVQAGVSVFISVAFTTCYKSPILANVTQHCVIVLRSAPAGGRCVLLLEGGYHLTGLGVSATETFSGRASVCFSPTWSMIGLEPGFLHRVTDLSCACAAWCRLSPQRRQA